MKPEDITKPKMTDVEVFDELQYYLTKLKNAKVKGWTTARLISKEDEIPDDLKLTDFDDGILACVFVYRRKFYQIWWPNHFYWLRCFRLGYAVLPFKMRWENECFSGSRHCARCGSRWVFFNSELCRWTEQIEVYFCDECHYNNDDDADADAMFPQSIFGFEMPDLGNGIGYPLTTRGNGDET